VIEISRSFSYLVICQCAEWTYQFYWSSQSAISIYKISFVEFRVNSHVFLVVRVERFDVLHQN